MTHRVDIVDFHHNMFPTTTARGDVLERMMDFVHTLVMNRDDSAHDSSRGESRNPGQQDKDRDTSPDENPGQQDKDRDTHNQKIPGQQDKGRDTHKKKNKNPGQQDKDRDTHKKKNKNPGQQDKDRDAHKKKNKNPGQQDKDRDTSPKDDDMEKEKERDDPALGNDTRLTGVQIQQFLDAWKGGDMGALDHLFPLVYNDLRGQARKRLLNYPGSGMQPTELVHELFVCLVRLKPFPYRDRGELIRMLTSLMQKLLAGYYRKKRRRAGIAPMSAFDDERVADRERYGLDPFEDEALRLMAKLDPRQHQVFILENCYGFPLKEVAAIMNLSLNQVQKSHTAAKCFFNKQKGKSL